MLFSIMLGAIIITYFVADIANQTAIDKIQTEHEGEIKQIQGKNENFTSLFLKSNVVLDQAREDRAFGNYNFDLASIWYYTALAEKNATNMESYKIRGIDNCTEALPNYINSHNNFLQSMEFFILTKNYTDYDKYQNVLDLYVNLTKVGAELTMYRFEASKYLMYLTENLTFNFETGNVTYLTNISEVFMLFNNVTILYGGALENYEELKDKIDEYQFFDEIR